MSPEAATGSPRIFLVAGEHSGDRLGAGLIATLRERAPGVAIAGVGGEAMVAAGLESLFPMTEIAVNGLLPVIARLPTLLRRIRDTATAVIAAKPDVLVIIDSPDFTHRVARRVRAADPAIPIVDLVSPTVWAWRPGRAPAMRAYVDHLLALLPFEPAAHERLGGPPCTYMGHPLIERLDALRPEVGDASARERPVLLVLPGSRRSEIRRLLAIFGETLQRVAAEVPDLEAVLPAVDDLADTIRAEVATWRVRPRIVTGEADKYAAFRQARAALAASGTVTLELALAAVPMAVAYRVSALEWKGRFVIKVPSIVLANLVIGETAVPEFLQDASNPEALARALVPLLGDTPARAEQLAAFARVEAAMRIAPGATPSGIAADTVLSCIDATRRLQRCDPRFKRL